MHLSLSLCVCVPVFLSLSLPLSVPSHEGTAPVCPCAGSEFVTGFRKRKQHRRQVAQKQQAVKQRAERSKERLDVRVCVVSLRVVVALLSVWPCIPCVDVSVCLCLCPCPPVCVPVSVWMLSLLRVCAHTHTYPEE